MERNGYSRHIQPASLQLAALAHDLRTPMSCVVGAAQMALAAVRQGKDVSAQMEQILLAVRTMDSMLAGLCDACSAESVFTADALYQTLLAMSAEPTKRRAQRLSIDLSALDGMEFRADFSLLTRVLMNLLGNAVKYTPEGGTISLRAELIRTGWLPGSGRTCVRFAVADSGMGMTRAFQRRMYAPYERAEESAHMPGSGIGLASVRQMVRQMGGTIHARSEWGKGTVFVVTVPVNCSNQNRHAAGGVTDETS